MALTANYYVFVENPIKLNLWRMLTEYSVGKACIAQCLDFQPSMRNKVHLVPRPDSPVKGLAARTIEVAGTPFFTFHFANAFEAPSGQVVVDLCGSDFIDLGYSTERPIADYYKDERSCNRFGRVVVDLKAGTVRGRAGLGAGWVCGISFATAALCRLRCQCKPRCTTRLAHAVPPAMHALMPSDHSLIGRLSKSGLHA